MIDKSYYQRPINMPERTSAGGVVCRITPEKKILFAVVCEAGDSRYMLPKGGVESGESLEEAAHREIGEEAGIHQLKLICKLGFLERMTFKKLYWSVAHFYLFTTDQIAFRPTDVAHTYTPEWWPLDKTDGMIWPEQKRFVEEKRALIKQALEQTLENEILGNMGGKSDE
jgi:ADP-ribose pyrophosphatase YjhB (NUDIX family)